MKLSLGIMFAGMALSWAALFFSPKRGSALKDSLARIDVHALAGCIFVLSQLMPAVRYGSLATPASSSLIVVCILAMEAGVCMSMGLMRGRERNLAVENWMSSTLARTISGGL